jgi:hypothetical protein
LLGDASSRYRSPGAVTLSTGAPRQVACLGVTEKDWRLLAMGALQGMSLSIARKVRLLPRLAFPYM